MPRITPNLWFDTEAKDAADFYVSIFPNSRITHVSHYGESSRRPAGTVLTVDFELDGQPYTAINGGPEFSFSEAISRCVSAAPTSKRSTTTGTRSPTVAGRGSAAG
jgi:predicted 3-demethylubiquinone-9 3-methyltransferase (glyoxalase superfamily)